MSREQSIQLDAIAMRYLAALDAGDFDAIDSIWEMADAETTEMLHGLNYRAVCEDEGVDEIDKTLGCQ